MYCVLKLYIHIRITYHNLVSICVFCFTIVWRLSWYYFILSCVWKLKTAVACANPAHTNETAAAAIAAHECMFWFQFYLKTRYGNDCDLANLVQMYVVHDLEEEGEKITLHCMTFSVHWIHRYYFYSTSLLLTSTWVQLRDVSRVWSFYFLYHKSNWK